MNKDLMHIINATGFQVLLGKSSVISYLKVFLDVNFLTTCIHFTKIQKTLTAITLSFQKYFPTSENILCI